MATTTSVRSVGSLFEATGGPEDFPSAAALARTWSFPLPLLVTDTTEASVCGRRRRGMPRRSRPALVPCWD